VHAPRHSRSSLMLLALAMLFVLMGGTPARGQDGGSPAGDEPAAAVADRGLESPQATVRTFRRAMGSGAAGADFERAVQCLDTQGLSDEAAAASAVELFEILERIETEGVDYMPDRAAVQDRSLTEYRIYPSTLLHGESDVYRAYPEGRIVIALQPDGAWRFDAETVAGARDFNRATSHLGSPNGDRSLRAVIRNLMPGVLTGTEEHEFLTLEYYQWLLLAVLIMLGVVLDHTVRLIILIVIRRALAKRNADAAEETRKRMVRPFGLFASAVLWFWGLQLLWLPVAAESVLLIAVRLFLMLATVWAANRVTDLIAEVAARRAVRTATRFDDVLIPLVRKSVKIFIVIIGVIYIAES
jgi:MscS family membrane protein